LELPPQFEQTPAWHEIRQQLRRIVGDSTYEIWLAALEVQAWDGQRLVLRAPAGSQAWVSKRFGRIVETCIRTVIGSAVQVAFAGRPSADARPVGEGAHAPLEFEDSAAFNPRYSFEQFIIGDGNRLAHAASLAVAELPGQAYNPLFLHAPPGLGKTHLLHAIGNFVLAFGGGATVRYTTVEAFTNHFITALHSKSVDRFKHAYRDADVLLIDDVQFLASKAKTEEEFFHTFNALYETGRQLVLTCDRLPRQLLTVEERLRERFESGLVADMRAPDFPTRLAILRKRAVLDRIALEDPSVLELIAERVTDNIRALEGALIRVVAHHSLSGHPINVGLATHVLDEMHPATRHSELAIDDIQAVVAGYYGISVAELTSSSRKARVAWARQVAIHLSRDLTITSLEIIGKAFGGRSHATVLHACKRVSERLRTDQQAVADMDQIVALLQAGDSDRSC
jgi:chromosomal replication initiator protein